MQIEGLQATLRPRTPWEAIDLGAVMARQWAGPMFRAWGVCVVPLQVLTLALLWTRPEVALLLLWWLKPLGDRVLLHVAASALFGEVPSVSVVVRALPQLWGRTLFSSLLWNRFDAKRSLWLPIQQLEGLRGAAFRQRRSLLSSGQGSAAETLSGFALAVEWALAASLLAACWYFIPEIDEGLKGWSQFREWEAEHLRFLPALVAVAIGAVAPFYVCGGFALYLNRRTLLEGWDIELAFRKMALRLRPHAPTLARVGMVLFAAALFLATSVPGAARAAEREAKSADPQVLISEILERPAFKGERTVEQEWVLNKDLVKEEKPVDPSWILKLSQVIAQGGKVFLGMLFAGVFLVLLFLALKAVKRARGGATNDLPAHAEVDVHPSSLPSIARLEDPVTQARALWQRGQAREALSVLYRAALQELGLSRQVSFPTGATERECVEAVRQHSPSDEAYFKTLARAWATEAYAHRPPEPPQFEALCEGWQSHFGSRP